MPRIATALAAAALHIAASARAEGPAPGRQGELSFLLTQDCGSCHGLTMKGGLGSPLLPESLAGKDREALAGVVLDGIPGTPMPPWRSLLTPEEALWIIDRLRHGGTP